MNQQILCQNSQLEYFFQQIPEQVGNEWLSFTEHENKVIRESSHEYCLFQ